MVSPFNIISSIVKVSNFLLFANFKFFSSPNFIIIHLAFELITLIAQSRNRISRISKKNFKVFYFQIIVLFLIFHNVYGLCSRFALALLPLCPFALLPFCPVSRQLSDISCQILAVRSDICQIGQLSDRTTVSGPWTTVRSDNCQWAMDNCQKKLSVL